MGRGLIRIDDVPPVGDNAHRPIWLPQNHGSLASRKLGINNTNRGGLCGTEGDRGVYKPKLLLVA
jgi:hypothetical protein